MHSDEEVKDGRYFPSEKEQSILMQTIEKYFQLPERSEERSVVVQTVTTQLSEINPRWNNRAVRLWFNNNKRACLKSQVQFDLKASRSTPVSPDQMPLKKRPPRSSSVGSFLPSRPFSAPSEFANDGFSRAFTDKLLDIHARKWRENMVLDPRFQIPLEPSTMIPEILMRYNTVECGMFVDGNPVVIGMDEDRENRVLRMGDRVMNLGCAFQTSSLTFDRFSDNFLIGGGKAVYEISKEKLAVVGKFNAKCPPMLRSAIGVWSDGIVLGNRKRMFIWRRDNSGPATVIDTLLPGISSLATVDGFVALGSRNYHAVHVFTDQGILARSCLGHGGGVTSLCTSDGTFLSGSVDQTVIMWDFRLHPPAAHYPGHRGPVTMVECANIQGIQYVLTGGEDHLIRVWDVRSQRPLFEGAVGSGIPISLSLKTTEEDQKLMTILTKEKESTCGEGFQVSVTGAGQFCEQCPNAALQFTFGPLGFVPPS